MKKFSEYLNKQDVESVNEGNMASIFDSKYYKQISKGMTDEIPGTELKYKGVPYVGLGIDGDDVGIIQTQLNNPILEATIKVSEKASGGLALLSDLVFGKSRSFLNGEPDELMSNLDKDTRTVMINEQVELLRTINQEIVKSTNDLTRKFNDAITKSYESILKSYEKDFEGLIDSLMEENKKIDPTFTNKLKKFGRKWFGGK